MGAGGQMNVSSNETDILERVPVFKPPFRIADLKKRIPPHCFERSLVRSLGSFFRDLFVIYSLYYLASNYIPLLPQSLSYVAWPLYWLAQGSILMGFWILGHECGHNAFSEYRWLDDALGLFIHSVTLTPYFTFKYSHRNHHAHTNSLEWDEVYIPKLKSDTFFSEFMNNGPGNVFILIIRVTLGHPLYMIFNTLGIFNDHDRELRHVVLSDVAIVAVLYALYHLFVTEGVKMAAFLYGIPLFTFSGIFIIVTYLNHAHPAVAHYDSTEWNWLRGALATIDRDYGMFLNWAFHHSNQNHVIHHLFPMLPHYHAFEATEAVKPIIGDYYKYDDTPILKAMWRDTMECIYVAPDENSENKGIYWYFK
ncbi:delta(12) fatty acid desaturase-like protein [Tanacetum coccineum]|uniref:Delta(12) fatty acid desaturase-like protein n=1 Tax=Tanacetum coccineum TaxID=301880 RepID=A0ABQ5DVV5_9ASTR